ncbi:GlpE, partial [Pasteurella multocida subsp. multocida str. Anand1_cattle]
LVILSFARKMLYCRTFKHQRKIIMSAFSEISPQQAWQLVQQHAAALLDIRNETHFCSRSSSPSISLESSILWRI